MPDFLLRGIDNAVAERIKTIARERNWSINDVILHLLKQSLGLTEADVSGAANPHQDIAMLGGTWNPDESAAFRAALDAFEGIPKDDSALTVAPPKR